MAESGELRVVVYALGRDGQLTCQILAEADIDCQPVESTAELTAAISAGCGAIILAEEVLHQGSVHEIVTALDAQPAWSDLPVMVVAYDSDSGSRLKAFSVLGNVSVLTRPMNLDALATIVWSALRARRRQYQVRELLADREAVARRKDEFLAMLAHELRNPLAPVRTTLHVLRMRHAADLDTSNAVSVADRSIQHMTRLIDDLLDASRVALGKVHLRPQLVDVAEIVRFASAVFRERCDQKRIRLSVSTPNTPLTLIGDPTRLEQVFANLLDNAVKFTSAGGTVQVRVGAEAGWGIVSVADSGAGIPEDDLPHVFEAFTQADRSLDRTTGGLGMGLTIAKGIVMLHGGEITVQSAGPERGTTATVRLPLQPEPTRAAPPAPPTSKRGTTRVLVVDDNRDGADSLAEFLTLTGCLARTAYDGPQALEVFNEFKPDAVLLDIGLPGMSGYEVAGEIRAQPEGQSVMLVAVTGYGRDEDRARGRSVGINHHLVKPVDLTTVCQLLTVTVPR